MMKFLREIWRRTWGNPKRLSLVVIFLIADALMLATGFYFWKEHQEKPVGQDAYPVLHAEVESAMVSELEDVAKQGSFSALEETRERIENQMTSDHARPSRGTALYFFPKMLSSKSLESDFAASELKPGIAALRSAYEANQPEETAKAMKLLQTRVESFELGTTPNKTEMSNDSQRFLKMYQTITKTKE